MGTLMEGDCSEFPFSEVVPQTRVTKDHRPDDAGDECRLLEGTEAYLDPRDLTRCRSLDQASCQTCMSQELTNEQHGHDENGAGEDSHDERRRVQDPGPYQTGGSDGDDQVPEAVKWNREAPARTGR